MNDQAFPNDNYIPSFSELWLHGATTLSPLGATIVEFESKCEGSQTTVSWSSIQENQCDYYVLEQSVDGIKWQTIFQTDCQNETEQINRYQFHVNKQHNLNYYRLWKFTLNDVPTLKGIITDNGAANDSELQLYPNPTTGIFHLTISMQEGDTVAMIEITDANGKVILSQNQEFVKGNNNVTFDMNYLPNGTYLVRMISQKKIFEIQKMIIHH